MTLQRNINEQSSYFSLIRFSVYTVSVEKQNWTNEFRAKCLIFQMVFIGFFIELYAYDEIFCVHFVYWQI